MLILTFPRCMARYATRAIADRPTGKAMTMTTFVGLRVGCVKPYSVHVI